MSLTLVAVGALIFVALALAWQEPLRAILRYRGVRLVTCPETKRPAAVGIDVGTAAITALVEGVPRVRLAACSRWPDPFPCDQACLVEVARNGRAATVVAIARRWFGGHRCAFSGRSTATAGSGHEPAIIGVDGVIRQWSAISPEQLPDLFASRAAVCWDCHIAETFRRAHPELVVDR
jgi:hypothetical protein